ncbi:transposase, partial [Dubosiella newyorkensis]|uniref:transposase n=1 Tax=Dubosiella newyorkensis TaxID=1862672 RepID=UPI0025ABCE1B
ALGRPAKNPNLSALLRKQEYQDLCDRNVVEGLFGTGKTAYGLGRISVRLEESSRCVIGVALLLWNLTKGLRSLWRA